MNPDLRRLTEEFLSTWSDWRAAEPDARRELLDAFAAVLSLPSRKKPTRSDLRVLDRAAAAAVDQFVTDCETYEGMSDEDAYTLARRSDPFHGDMFSSAYRRAFVAYMRHASGRS